MKHMEWIRKTYNVPAKRGARVEYGNDTDKFIMGFLYKPKRGTIVAARGGYLRIRFDHTNQIVTHHPTYGIKYL